MGLAEGWGEEPREVVLAEAARQRDRGLWGRRAAGGRGPAGSQAGTRGEAL